MSALKLNANIILESCDKGIISKIIADNTFTNPKYRDNIINRRSNWDTAPIIKTYGYDGEKLILPRGYMRTLIKCFHEHNIAIKMDDERISQACTYPDRLNEIVLRPYQQRAVDSAMKFDQGVVISPTGSGKSLIGLEIIRRRQQKALVIVHRADLATQWKDNIEKWLKIKPGMIGNGCWEIGEHITIALIQTLASREEQFKELTNSFGLILCDEMHHVPSETYFTVMNLLSAKHRYGLSATTQRRDGLEEIIYRCVGPVIEEISREEVEDLGAVVHATVKAIETGFSPLANSWHEYLTQISESSDRNLFIIKLAIDQISPVLILCDRVAHAENLSKILSKQNINHVLAHGQVQDRDKIMEKIKEAQITIATTSLIGEGIDVSSWSVLIMASPISSEIRLMQAIGRIVRPSTGKKIALVFDLKDDCRFSGSSFKKRFEVYKKHKIWVEFSKNKKAARR